jgi:ribosomal protein S18 acetylase RimI-like enzyme
MLRIEVATLARLDELAELFDAYRVFYGRPGDVPAARRFLQERLSRGDSHILCAVDAAGRAVGFTQLYPSFSSVSMGPIWVLNDLFVAPEARRSGAGRLLLAAAASHALETSALRLELQTQKTNLAAQSLYEREGWRRDDEFYHYQLPVVT